MLNPTTRRRFLANSARLRCFTDGRSGGRLQAQQEQSPDDDSTPLKSSQIKPGSELARFLPVGLMDALAACVFGQPAKESIQLQRGVDLGRRRCAIATIG